MAEERLVMRNRPCAALHALALAAHSRASRMAGRPGAVRGNHRERAAAPRSFQGLLPDIGMAGIPYQPVYRAGCPGNIFSLRYHSAWLVFALMREGFFAVEAATRCRQLLDCKTGRTSDGPAFLTSGYLGGAASSVPISFASVSLIPAKNVSAMFCLPPWVKCIKSMKFSCLPSSNG